MHTNNKCTCHRSLKFTIWESDLTLSWSERCCERRREDAVRPPLGFSEFWKRTFRSRCYYLQGYSPKSPFPTITATRVPLFSQQTLCTPLCCHLLFLLVTVHGPLGRELLCVSVSVMMFLKFPFPVVIRKLLFNSNNQQAKHLHRVRGSLLT